MGAIIDFLKGFVDIISSIVNFFISTIMDLVYMIGLLGSMLTNLPAYFGWIPSAIVSSILVIFSIVVIYKIIGREG